MQTRRAFGALSMGAVTSSLLAPLRAAERAAKPVRIKNIEIFPIEVPHTKEEWTSGMYVRFTVVKVETDVGVRGYTFSRGNADKQLGEIRSALVGKDLFAIEEHLKAGRHWGGTALGCVENAIWDAIGKIAGQPVYRLLGGAKTKLKTYYTVLWPGRVDQMNVPVKEFGEMAARLKKAGVGGMKIRIWMKPDYIINLCREMRAAAGPDFVLAFDRTGELPDDGAWNYQTGLRVARGLEQYGPCWLEEPYHRDDIYSYARLAREVDLPIAGGEAYKGLAAYRECLVQEAFDMVITDPEISGGMFVAVKVAAMAQAFNRSAQLHGAMGLRLAAWLQTSAAIGAPWQEIAAVAPPGPGGQYLGPEAQWNPGLKVLNSKEVFVIRDGEIEVPQGPGLGLDINEDALQKYRIPPEADRRPTLLA